MLDSRGIQCFVPVISCTLLNDRDKMTWQIFICLFVLTATVVSNESSTGKLV